MAQIIIQNLSEKIVKVTGLSQTFLQVFHQQNIDWMQACGGKGRCTTCKVIVLEGHDNLNLLTQSEKKYKAEGALSESARLACQAKINGDVRIAVPEEYKLPHIKYSD